MKQIKENYAFRAYSRDLAHATALLEQTTVRGREELFLKNLGLVITIASKHQGRGVPLLDLIQEGNIALWEALGSFDPNKGALSSYAGRSIRHAVWNALKDNARNIRIPWSAQDGMGAFPAALDALAKKLGRVPSDKEIALALGLRMETIRFFKENCHLVGRERSLHELVGMRGKKHEFGEVLPDQTSIHPAIRLSALEAAEMLAATIKRIVRFTRNRYGERAVSIFVSYYGLHGEEAKSFDDLAKIHGFKNRQRPRAIVLQILAQARKAELGAYSLMGFWNDVRRFLTLTGVLALDPAELCRC